jgi:HEAT repeat protein
MTDEAHFGRALETIRSGRKLTSEELAALSHPNREELAALEPVWSGLTPDDRVGVLAQLAESERANLRQEFNPIYKLAFDDPSPAVRRQAVASIVEDPNGSLLDDVIRLATADPDAGVREAAARALAPFALRAELGELPATSAEALQRALLGVLAREGEGVAARREALSAVGYLDNAEVSSAIRQSFEEPELRVAAVRAMGRTANAVWLPTLTQQAASDEPLIREEVARACGEMADQRSTKIVANLVDDRVIDVRLAAIAALGQIGGEEAREALLYAVEDKREAIREAAAAALSDLELDEDPLGL